MDNLDVALYFINKGIRSEEIASRLNIPIRMFERNFRRPLTNGEKKDIIRIANQIETERNRDV